MSRPEVPSRSTVLVTGASGFIGSALIRKLASCAEYRVRAAIRKSSLLQPIAGVETIPFCDLAPEHDWEKALTGVDVVVHAAARVHVMKETSLEPLSEFRKTNVEGTLRLAREAARLGVRRFVFLSSIKVNGEASEPGRPFTAGDEPRPEDYYGLSKAEAENALRDLSSKTGLEVTIVRPPLVYGPGVKANFLSMIRWMHRGLPLPLDGIRNLRSFVAVDNLVDLLLVCTRHPEAANRTFLASDGEDLSTSELLRRTARAMGKTARLFRVPHSFVETAAKALGRGAAALRLFGSLQADIASTRKTLDWSPPVTVDEALARTVRAFLETRSMPRSAHAE